MTKQPKKAPNRDRILVFGSLAMVAAGGVAGYEIMGQTDANKRLAQCTSETAILTVQLADLQRGAAEQSLVLPGTIQPYMKAAIHSRVNGYVKSWSRDIGANVKTGDVLASIEAPDLDQQLAQAKATLASGKASSDLAAITSNCNDILVKKQIVAQQLADQIAADAAGKEAAADALAANVRQLEAMQAFKELVAPFDGVATARNTDVGALIDSGSTGQPLFEVSDLHRVRIYVQVPQSLSAGLGPGL